MFGHTEKQIKHTIKNISEVYCLCVSGPLETIHLLIKANVISQPQQEEETGWGENRRSRRRGSRREEQKEEREVKSSISNNHFILASLYFYMLCQELSHKD